MPFGFATPWHSHALFGHLCRAAKQQGRFQGFAGASGLSGLFRGGDLPFVLSNGFPAGLLPAPVTLQHPCAPQSQDLLDCEAYARIKRAKRRKYLAAELLRKSVQKAVDHAQAGGSFRTTEVRPWYGLLVESIAYANNEIVLVPGQKL